MSGAVLRMSDTETLKFLDYYRNEPALWHPTNDGYKNKSSRAAAAQRIAKALNLPEFTASHVIIKFKNLRSSYAQELKKIARSTTASNDDAYVPKVIWFKQMDAFLRPHVKSRTFQSYLNDSTHETVPGEGNANSYDNEHHQSQTQFRNIQLNADSEQSENSSEQHESSSHQPSTEYTAGYDYFNKTRSPASCHPQTSLKRSFLHEPMQQKKRSVDRHTPSKIMSAVNKLGKISERRAVKGDNFDYFGRYIAALLRSLPAKKALMLQQEISTLVLNAHISSASSTQPMLREIQREGGVFSSTSSSEESDI